MFEFGDKVKKFRRIYPEKSQDIFFNDQQYIPENLVLIPGTKSRTKKSFRDLLPGIN